MDEATQPGMIRERLVHVVAGSRVVGHQMAPVQRPASIRVSTPMEQPGSKALRYRAAGNNARLTAYLRCSYQRSSKPHGSAAAWYMASK